jgi:hypothetical protein
MILDGRGPPRVVYWLAGAQRAGSGNVKDLGPWIGRLAAIGKAEPELRDDFYRLIEAMRQLPTSAGQSAATPVAGR